MLLTGLLSVAHGQGLLTPEVAPDPGIKIKKVVSGHIIHRFHDTSPISPSGKYIALFRIPFEDHYPVAGDFGEVVLVDLASGKEEIVAKSFGWEMQVGANVQWGGSDEELFYNQVDTVRWEAFTVLYNPLTRRSRRIDGWMFMASADGKKLVSHNLINSIYAQSGYGVIVPEKYRTRHHGLTDSDGIFVADVKSGKSRMIVSLKKMFEKATPAVGIPDPEHYQVYGFKAMWNPQGTRIMTCMLFYPKGGGRRKVAVITLKPDGTDIRTAITTDQYAKGGHHMAWMPDGDHFSMNLEMNDARPGLELVTVRYDGSNLKEVFNPGSGHPSFHPKGLPLIVTDAYRHETSVTSNDGYVPVRLLNTATGKEILIAKVRIPDVSDNSFRLDPHPTWDRTGRFVIFNGYDDASRGVYIADLQHFTQTK
ncbi:MAG: hypothetical protein ABS46_08765 [Cytophagaceae bacterium SCN 52-12]|nr:MAG: hypothetical protein ABS46_08765 [Cytophagaceae bacterium SCN 52-12]